MLIISVLPAYPISILFTKVKLLPRILIVVCPVQVPRFGAAEVADGVPVDEDEICSHLQFTHLVPGSQPMVPSQLSPVSFFPFPQTGCPVEDVIVWQVS